MIWKEVKDVRIQTPTVKTFFLGLATFMLQVAPAWVDVGSDWVTGISFLLSGEYIWGFLSLLLTFLPGLGWWTFRHYITKGEKKWQLPFLLSCLFYPLFVTSYKLLTWLTEGRAMKAVAPRVSVTEVTYEALPQLALQVFIVLRSGEMPGWTQLASIVSSFLTATVGPAEDFLVLRQVQLRRQAESNSSEPVEAYTVMTLGKKLPLLARFLPFFLCQTVSRVLALSFTSAVLHHYALALYIPVIISLGLCFIAYPARKYRRIFSQVVKEEGWGILMIPLRSMVTNTSADDFPDVIFQLVWSILNLLLCAILATIFLTGNQDVLPGWNIHPDILPTAINVSIAVIGTVFVTTIASLALFIWGGVRSVIDPIQQPAPLTLTPPTVQPPK